MRSRPACRAQRQAARSHGQPSLRHAHGSGDPDRRGPGPDEGRQKPQRGGAAGRVPGLEGRRIPLPYPGPQLSLRQGVGGSENGQESAKTLIWTLANTSEFMFVR